MNYSVIRILSESGKSSVSLVAAEGYDAPIICKKLKNTGRHIYELLKASPNPHIPTVYEIVEAEESLEVFEEYCDGETLDRFLAQNSPDTETRIAMMLQLCEALEFIHSFDPPIIHRDIKPSNILINSEGILKLIDFDASRLYDEHREGSDTVLLGTQEYAAPEQFGYAQTSVRSDIYSLGVVFSELGIPSDDGSFYRKWRAIIAKCTSFDPSDRYPDVGAVHRAIDAASGKRSFWRIAACIAIPAVTLAILFFVFINHSSTVSPELPELPESISASPISETPTPTAVLQTDSPGEAAEPSTIAEVPDSAKDPLSAEVPDNTDLFNESVAEETERSETPLSADSADTGLSENPEDDSLQFSEAVSDYLTEEIWTKCNHETVDWYEGIEHLHDFPREKVTEFTLEQSRDFNLLVYQNGGLSFYEFYPNCPGTDFLISFPNFYYIGYRICGVQIIKLETGEVFPLQLDDYYIEDSFVYIKNSYLRTLDQTVYKIQVRVLNADDERCMCSIFVAIHDQSFYPVWQDVMFPNTPTFLHGKNKFVRWYIPYNCDHTIKNILDTDLQEIDPKLYKISENGLVLTFYPEMFKNVGHYDRVELYVYFNEREGYEKISIQVD